MALKEDIKILLLKDCMTMKKLSELMTEKMGKTLSPHALSQKLTKGTLRHYELEAICEILGYKIEYKKIN